MRGGRIECELSPPGACPPVRKKSMSANGCTTTNEVMKAQKGTDAELQRQRRFLAGGGRGQDGRGERPSDEE